MNHTKNESGCNVEKILKAYGELNGELHLVELGREAGATCLGLSLAGNCDLATMSVFVVGIQPGSVAASNGTIRVGDELLEINGQVLFGRSHLNASAIIKAISSSRLKILLIRSEDYSGRMAVSPLRLPPITYKDSLGTLIPKKSTSLSLDESQMQDLELSSTSDIINKQESECSTTSSSPPNDDPRDPDKVETTATISTATACSVDSSQKNSETSKHDDDDILTKPNSTSPTLEKENSTSSSSERLLRPDSRTAAAAVNIDSQPKGGSSSGRPPRLLQKSAQVEDAEEEEDEPRSRDADVDRLATNRLKSEDARPVLAKVEIVTADGDWNRFRVEEISPETSTNSSSPLHPSGSAVLEDPTTSAIVAGSNRTIEIRKGKTGLGLKVIGGSDTLLKVIVIYEIYKNGAAAKDGRLWPGDQITEVNGQDLRNATNFQAVQILRQASSSVRMVVFRDESSYRDDDLSDSMTIELVKKPGKGLGLSIVARRDDNGVLISDIVKGGVADADGRLFPGDQILVVNGEDTRNVTQEYAAELLKTLMGKITMTIGRLKVAAPKPNSARSRSSHGGGGTNSREILKSESNASDCKAVAKRTQKRNTIGSVVSCLQAED